MRNLLLILSLAFLMLSTGCKSYMTVTRTTTTFDTEGRPTAQVVETRAQEASPFYYKCVSSVASVFGIEASFVDPQSGAWSPNIKFLTGRASAGTVPVTTGSPDTKENFGTMRETFGYEKSYWGASIGSMSYDRIAGGKGVLCKPSVQIIVNMDAAGSAVNTPKSSEVKK